MRFSKVAVLATLVIACSDSTEPEVAMSPWDSMPTHIKDGYSPVNLCEFGAGQANHHRSLACWSAFLNVIGAKITMGGACAIAFARPSQATVGACVTTIGVNTEAWNKWSQTVDSDGHRDWSDHEIDRRMNDNINCRMGRGGC